MPLPSEDTTPPVTKTNLVMSMGICFAGRGARLEEREARAGMPWW